MNHIETVQALVALVREQSAKFVYTAARAGEVAALLNAGDALAVELARRNQEDPSTRLHNVCQAIAEDADGSAFSREEWERIDAENKELRALLAELQAGAGQPVAPEPKWIVNDLGELGVEVAGRFFFLYKGGNIEYGQGADTSKDGMAIHDEGTPMNYRMVGKREFGEVCHPITCHTVENGVIYDRTPFPYTKELVFTPGLSFGEPEDGAWKPLPARPVAGAHEHPSAEPICQQCGDAITAHDPGICGCCLSTNPPKQEHLSVAPVVMLTEEELPPLWPSSGATEADWADIVQRAFATKNGLALSAAPTKEPQK